ncbi:hypothetical protein SAMN04489806_1958 [Paramicrobacterium humi]|uniref:DUF2975 domain-containing protein n=1 Tax=Paramicrobacterium humi TaxID=640635 RepID=A0A1H4MRE6_9MICO|nr:hypothetical protein [Microbacterium humi]SEB85616.1 hypothetical protein SAMN04489806_1958 [Microbacterium humi]
MNSSILKAVAGRGALLTIMVIAALVGLVAVGLAIWFVEWTYSRPFAFSVGYAAPGYPDVASTAETAQFYDSISVESDEPLDASRALRSVAIALPLTMFVAGALGVIVLARRLLSSRPFARAARGLLVAIAALAAAVGIAVPALEAAATASAVAALSMPTDGFHVADPDSQAWVVPAGFELQDLNWPVLALATVLLLIALVWRHGERLQRDTEGLV